MQIKAIQKCLNVAALASGGSLYLDIFSLLQRKKRSQPASYLEREAAGKGCASEGKKKGLLLYCANVKTCKAIRLEKEKEKEEMDVVVVFMGTGRVAKWDDTNMRKVSLMHLLGWYMVYTVRAQHKEISGKSRDCPIGHARQPWSPLPTLFPRRQLYLATVRLSVSHQFF
jgi:hypothetical protein